MKRKVRKQQGQIEAIHQTVTSTETEPFIRAKFVTRSLMAARGIEAGGGGAAYDDTVRADTIKIRRDTIAAWETNSGVVLEEGEIGLIMPKTQSLSMIEPLKCKIGDGVHTWAELPQQSWVSTAGMSMASASGMIPVYDGSGSIVPSSQSLAEMVDTILGLENSIYTIDLLLGTIDGSRTYEYASATGSVTLWWSSSRYDEPKVPTQVVYYRTGSNPADNYEWDPITPTEANGQWTDNYSPLGKITYGVRATVDSIDTKTELGLNWVLPCYLGFYDSGSTVEEMTGSLTKVVTENIGTNAKTTYELTNSYQTPEYLTMCLPTGMNFYQARSNGIMIPLQNPVADTSIIIEGVSQSYQIYRSANRLVPGSVFMDVYTED